MNNERIIEDRSQADSTTFTVLLDGNEMEPEYQVMSIAITKEVNRVPSAKLVIRDGEASEEDFPISNKSDFAPGTEVEIKAGKDGIEETVFKGIVIKQGIKVKQDGNAFLRVECKDQCVKLSIGRKNCYYENLSDSEIIKKILNRNKMMGTVEQISGKHKESVQYYATDWDFIVGRAEMNGKLVIPDDGQIKVEAPKTEGEPDLTLIFGDTLFEFEAEMDARYQWKAVKASSWNYTNQQLLEARSNQAAFQEPGNLTGTKLSEVINLEEFEIQHSGHVLQEELQAWADASLLKSRLAKNRGRAKSIGVPKMKPGMLLELKGVGDRYNGLAYVTGVRHELVEGSMYTHLQFGLDPEWFSQKMDITELPASGLLPAIHGVQIGKVVQIHEDPEGEDRVLVKLPIISQGQQGIWSRVASLDAGGQRGAFFRPEVDDEVICGFVNGDPRDVIILGMLHSKALPAPLTAEQTNPEKGFITRENIRLLFNDVDRVVTIETPGSNKVIISDKDQSIKLNDQHGSSIVMDSSGITINSSKAVNITAKTNISISANANLSAEGANVNVKGKAALVAEGMGTATFSSNGVTTLTGSAQVLIF